MCLQLSQTFSQMFFLKEMKILLGRLRITCFACFILSLDAHNVSASIKPFFEIICYTTHYECVTGLQVTFKRNFKENTWFYVIIHALFNGKWKSLRN